MTLRSTAIKGRRGLKRQEHCLVTRLARCPHLVLYGQGVRDIAVFWQAVSLKYLEKLGDIVNSDTS